MQEDLIHDNDTFLLVLEGSLNTVLTVDPFASGWVDFLCI